MARDGANARIQTLIPTEVLERTLASHFLLEFGYGSTGTIADEIRT